MPEEQEQQSEQQRPPQEQQRQQQPPPKPQSQQPPPAQEQHPQEPPPRPKVSDDQFTALLAEVTKLRTKTAQYEAAEERRREEEARRQQKELIEGGQLERLVRQHDEEIARANRKAIDAEERYKQAERRRELSLALAGHKLVKGAAEQLTRLWDNEFDVFPQGDGWQVRSKDLKSPKDWVAERLASEEYAHFVVAESRGGRGAGGGQSAAATPGQSGQPPRKMSMAEDLARRMTQEQEQQPGYIPGRGLRRIG